MSLDVERILGAVTIYRHRRSGLCSVQPMCRRGRFGLSDAGQPESLPAGDDEALVRTTERALDSYRANVLTADTPRFSSKEQAQFVREHDSIMVVRLEEGIEVTPWDHTRGGFGSADHASILLPPPVSATSLADAIREAFKQAR
jgi:hypothetical protein